MNVGTFLLGAIILVAGIFGFMYGNQQVQEGQELTGELNRALSDEAQQEYETASLMRNGGLAAIALGALISIAGIVSSSNSSSSSQQREIKSEPEEETTSVENEENEEDTFYCSNCGKEVEEGTSYCPDCGEELQQPE